MRLAAVVVAVAGTLTACGSAAGANVHVVRGWTGRGGVDEAYITGTKPGTPIELVNGSGKVVSKGTSDPLGSDLATGLTPGSGYVWRTPGADPSGTASFSVLSPTQTPPASLYSSQHLHEGLNYITMRDGVKLAATVRLPQGKTLADGPFPTVIEYSGYQVAAPGNLLNALLKGGLGSSASLLAGGSVSNNPLLPDTATILGSVVAPLLGFASVSLQMRGSGCSGGAFDLFAPDVAYDGYDSIQTIAAQPWVAHHKVGMVGISFSGISQMFAAGTRPPGLAAIAPFSLTNDLYADGYPGGMFNNGFTQTWIAQRIHDAQPGPQGGQPYVKALIDQGDTTCLANQALHDQYPSAFKEFESDQFRSASTWASRAPETWAAKVDVPVYLAGQFQDEETGGQWTDIVPALAHDPNVFVTMTNGTHIDSLGPDTMARWLEFLDIFVAQKVPTPNPLLQVGENELGGYLSGTAPGPLPALRFTDAPNVATARAQFEKDTPRVRVLMDNGGTPSSPGSMAPEWEADYTAWPPPAAQATTFDMGSGGTLGPAGAGAPAVSSTSFTFDPGARPVNDLPHGNVWSALPPYQWAPVSGSDGLGFISAPLTSDLTVVGNASVNVEVKSSAPNTDLQATISEVRPDGTELFVQTGAIDTADRTLSPTDSTATEPVPTYQQKDVAPLDASGYTLVRIPIMAFAYSFRAGSRIRVTITAPGGDRPAWQFTLGPGVPSGPATDTIGLGGAQPSALVLSVIPGVVPPDPQPACPSLRGEPCRAYVPAQNGG